MIQYKLYGIFILFFFNIIIHSLVEKSDIKIPDFRWTKTICSPTYGYWMNYVNEEKYYDKYISPYTPYRICWVLQNQISFNQPIIPYEIFVYLDIIIFIIGLLFFDL